MLPASAWGNHSYVLVSHSHRYKHVVPIIIMAGRVSFLGNILLGVCLVVF